MATNLFKGRSANLLVSGTSTGTGTKLGALQDWKITVASRPINVTNFDSSGWDQFLDGIKGWTLTAQTLVLSTAGTLYSDQHTLRSALSSGTRQWVQVKNSTASGSQTYAGYAYVANWDQGGNTENAQLHNFTMTGDGKLTES